MSKLLALASLIVGLFASSGCSDVKCGTGTFANGKDCVGYDPNDKDPPVVTLTPSGGRSRDPLPPIVMMTTNEDATIYYTADGSDPDPAATSGETAPVTLVGVLQGETVKYIAVDRAGNRTAIESATFESDTTAPGPVGSITVTLNGTTPHVQWTPPTDADYAGTVVARVVDIIDVAPPAGQMVTNGSMISPSLQVVSVGTATSFDDAALPPGPTRYVAWTYDDLGNYSTGKAASASIPIGALTGTLTFNTTNNSLTMAAPANFSLTGTTANNAGGTLTVNLSIKNNTNQYFLNPKIEAISTTNGTFTQADGNADGKPFKSLGPDVFAPGATKTVSLVYTGATATVTMNIAFATHSSMTVQSRRRQGTTLVDYGSGQTLPEFTTTGRGPQDRVGGIVRFPVLTGGRFLDLPTTHGTIERYDLVNHTTAGVLNLGTGDRTNIQWLIANRGELLALVKTAGKRTTGSLELVRIDEGLHELGRVKLTYSGERGFVKPAVSPDGNTMAFPVVGGILLLDLQTLAPIDAVPATAPVDLIPTGFTGRVKALAFFNGTDGIVAIARDSGQAVIIKRANGDYTKTPYQDANANVRGFGMAQAPDGKVWFNFDEANGVRIYDPVADTVTNSTYAPQAQGIANVEGQMWIIRTNKTTLDQVDLGGAIQRTVTLPTTGLPYTPGAIGHTLDSIR
ncbi:MAG TPA: chitobiase/beta-hexosaminidase C-terminal domain-containing protein [Kofleriaceae bacterium]|nr:chitobiase/beta-hexosaminidase C-terminal domain-containing protein [Kofleriaceae bacterium]